jgi:hypothetical protein
VLAGVPAVLFGQKKKSSKAAAPYALIAGTIYRPPGLALPGAKITVTPETAPQDEVKVKRIQEVTNARGEFAIRVPPVPTRYRVDVKANGYQSVSRSVQVETEDRYELSIVLDPATSNK